VYCPGSSARGTSPLSQDERNHASSADRATTPFADPSSITHPPRMPPSRHTHTHTPAPNRIQPRRLNRDLCRLGCTQPTTQSPSTQIRRSAVSTTSLGHIPLYSIYGAWHPWQTQRRAAYGSWPLGVAWAWLHGGVIRGGPVAGLGCLLVEHTQCMLLKEEMAVDVFGLGNGGVKRKGDGREVSRRCLPFIV
jgi:hypothetical protein